MASHGSPTRVQPSSPPPPAVAPPRDGGLELSTLVLSAVASAAAAYVTSKVWVRGTLASAAMSPVIVALVKEALRKPTDLVASTLPSPRSRGRTTRFEPLPDDLPERLDAGAPPPFPPPDPIAPAGPVRIYSTRGRRLRWRIALATGLLGFALCAVVYTVPDVIAGHSVVGSGHRTTLWGGARHHAGADASHPAETTTSEGSTGAAAATPAPAQTVQTVTAPAQTVTVAPPTATQPPPTTTTAPPPAATTTPQAAPPPADGTQTTPAG